MEQLIWGVIFTIGISYAYIVASAWKSGNLGDVILKAIVAVVVTNSGISLLIWTHPILGQYTWEILVIVWGSYLVTGLPMATFMYAKHQEQERTALIWHEQDKENISEIFRGRK